MLKRKRVLLVVIASLVLILSLSLMGIDGCTKTYTLVTNVSPAGGGSVSPSSGQYDDGAVITLVAIPASGYNFAYWSGSASGSNPSVTIVMNANMNVTAFFEAAPEYTLTTNVSPAGGGSVSPSGGQYPEGTAVTLTATPAGGYNFDHWSGGADGSNPNTTVTMNSNMSVTANFAPIVTVLFQDDFSVDTGTWDVFSWADGEAFFWQGRFHTMDITGGNYTWSYCYQNFSDFVLEVETELVAGTDDNWHIIDVRDNGSDWYSFRISADGYYAIVRYIGGFSGGTLLDGGTSPYINLGWNVTNLVHIECVGNRLSLSVNGHLLTEVYDSTLTAGDMSLGVESLAGTFSEIAWDNIIVTSP
jgi:hypothetical protein